MAAGMMTAMTTAMVAKATEPLAAADLPAGLGEPLHLLTLDEGWPGGWLWALLALALAWLYRRWRRRDGESSAHEPRSAAPTPGPPQPSNALARAIDTLRREVLVSADFRDGCYRLAELLRRHGEAMAPYRLSVLTAGEIVNRLGESGLGMVFGLLADLQFRRRDPSRDEFVDICELATVAADPAAADPAAADRRHGEGPV